MKCGIRVKGDKKKYNLKHEGGDFFVVVYLPLIRV